MLRNYTAYFVVECNGIDCDTYTDAGFILPPLLLRQ